MSTVWFGRPLDQVLTAVVGHALIHKPAQMWLETETETETGRGAKTASRLGCRSASSEGTLRQTCRRRSSRGHRLAVSGSRLSC